MYHQCEFKLIKKKSKSPEMNSLYRIFIKKMNILKKNHMSWKKKMYYIIIMFQILKLVVLF